MAEDRFGEHVAAHYDESSADMFRPEILGPAVALLADLAGDGPVLEFGVGTGRVALPLRERGLDVHGIDLSEAMLDELRRKPGADSIGVTQGDFAATRVDGSFRLVYLVFNTITNLTTQDEQVACFENASRHLAPGGCFVIETYVPKLRALPPGERIRAFDLSPDHLGFDEYRDFTAQISVSHHVFPGQAAGEARTTATPFRYVWPSELDLMARLAGLRLRHRWADWERAPFTDDSPAHVSVWQRPAG